ncbi:MAG: peptidylprolyl isomerase [Ruminococcus sp.]|nr:peptidylprolyl isomerase [Ruminococcus sp.]
MKKFRGVFLFTIIASFILLGATVVLLYFSAKRQQNDRYITIDPETIQLVQLEPPKDGDPIAIIDTTLGELRIALYPDQSPDAVNNFTELAESGWYDNTYIFDSMEGVYASGGCKQKNGELNERINDPHETIERELSQDLWPFRGAVCMINTKKDSSFKNKLLGGGQYYNGSCFMFVDEVELDDDSKQELLDASENKELGQAFIERGGVPNLSQQMTIIGQTYEGLDVIDALTSLETENNGKYLVPKEDIMIKSVKIDTYSAEESSNNKQ